MEFSIFISSLGCSEASIKAAMSETGTTLIFKVHYYMIKNVSFLFVSNVLCENYYKAVTVQCYIAACFEYLG